MIKSKDILHITPHLGGGVGTVLLNWLDCDKLNKHTIATLDFANEKAIQFCEENNIGLFSNIIIKDLLQKIEVSDITVIHFWNHPLLYDFLIRNSLPSSRVVIWAHVLGKYPPYVFNNKLLDICDKFIFTNPISSKYILNSSKIASILSTGGIERFENFKLKKHTGYNIGYIGTVDFAKMHPDFVSTINKTSADKVFIVGGDKQKEIFKNAPDKFIIKGKMDDITPVLEELDVFCYLLNPNHYGTGEQVLQEAMSVGVVPAVLNNDTEKSIVIHNETGLIADDLEEYIKYIDLLKNDLNLRKRLSENAINYAKNNFTLESLKNQWEKVFEEVIKIKKTEKIWKNENKEITSFDIFLESLGEYSYIFKNKNDEELRKILQQPNWSSDTKATPKQYYKFLKGEEMAHICSLY